jgi:hypothetical protein
MWSRLEEGSNWADLILDESTMQRYNDPYDHDEVSYCMEHIGPPADARGLQIQDARIRNNFRTDQDLAGSIFRMFTTDLSPPLNRQAINRLRELQIAQDTCHLRFNQVIEDLTAHSGSRPQVPTKTHDNEQQRVRDWFHAAQGNLAIKGWKNAFQTQWSTYEHHLTLTQHRWRGGPFFLPTTRDIHSHLPQDMNLPEMYRTSKIIADKASKYGKRQRQLAHQAAAREERHLAAAGLLPAGGISSLEERHLAHQTATSTGTNLPDTVQTSGGLDNAALVPLSDKEKKRGQRQRKPAHQAAAREETKTPHTKQQREKRRKHRTPSSSERRDAITLFIARV